MNTLSRFRALKTAVCLAVFVAQFNFGPARAALVWEAFNDHRPTDGVTSPNASTYDLRAADDGGVLRNIATGDDLPVTVLVTVEGDAVPDDFGANSPVDAGSPADKLFNGKVDIGNAGLPGVRASAGTKLILNFTGLNPARRYNFRGTVSRGGNYNDRWSLFTLTGTEAFAAAHEDGSVNKNIFTKATFDSSTLLPNQVALNSGENKAGSLVGWDNIEPGADGTFEIVAEQYTGAAPFGNPAAAPYGYGMNAIYLAEVEATGSLRVTENPANQIVPAGATATFRVTASSPQTIAYQWQRAAAGGASFADISGATQSSYTTPVLVAGDHGAKFRCVLTSGGASATSGEAVLSVDGVIPSVASVVGGINLNAVHVTFSEPMKLETLGRKENYQLSGGLTVASAVALDPTRARLVTSQHTSDARYTLTVSNIEDLAGNKIPANNSKTFSGYSVQPGTVGIEIWNNIGGGAIADLRGNARYPGEPDVDYTAATLNSELVVPNGPLNTYGGRMRAWLTPEETGEYEFFLRADDTGELRISENESFADLENPERLPNAVDASAGDTFQESGVDESTSQPIQLERGKRYALQVLWKESNGNDYGQVAWRKVGDSTPAAELQPIPSKFLSYYGPGAVPQEDPKITRFSLAAGQLVLEWTGGQLQSTADLKVWADETGAVSPFRVTPTGQKFYRIRN